MLPDDSWYKEMPICNGGGILIKRNMWAVVCLTVLVGLSACGGGGGSDTTGGGGGTTSDTTAPKNTTASNFMINGGASSTSSPLNTISISATDSVGVTGYFVSETSTTPSATASGWTSITSTTSYSADLSFTLSSGNGTKTVYVWFKDAAGNVSTSVSGTIALQGIVGGGSDSTAPINTTKSNFINRGATAVSSTSVTLSISATDDVGVTGYYASETSAPYPGDTVSGWTSITSATSYSADVPFTLSSGDATKRVSVWFKDAAGNFSTSMSATIALHIDTPPIPPWVKWVYTTWTSIPSSGGAIYYSSPAIGDDGTIYVTNEGTATRGLYAINPDGTLKWSYLKGMPTVGVWDIMSSPVLGPDGTIYMQNERSNLYAVNPNGSLKWNTTNLFTSLAVGLPTPSVGSDGTIYIGADSIYAFNPDGTLKWRSNIINYVGSSTFRSGSAIAADGTIYIGGSGYFGDFPTNYGSTAIFAINPDGTVKWQYLMKDNSWIFSSPAIGADGSIYLGVETGAADTDNNYVYAMNPDGTLKWRYVVEGGRTIRSSPAIGSDGTIYIGTKAGPVVNAVFLALNPDGTLKWFFPIDEFAADIYCSPTIGANGIIYFGAETGFLYAMNPDGTLAWKYSTNNGINWSSPAIASDGTIYIGNNDGKLFAIGSNSLGLANTPWPRVHHDNKNTGRSN